MKNVPLLRLVFAEGVGGIDSWPKAKNMLFFSIGFRQYPFNQSGCV